MHKNSEECSSTTNQNPNQKKRNEVKFIDSVIKSLKIDEGRKTFWCVGLDGFGIRVSRRGTKVWIYLFHWKEFGHSVQMTLGRYPRMSVQEARKKYFEARDKVLCGINPVEKRFYNNNEVYGTSSVNELAYRYIEYCKARGEKSWKEKKRAINKEVLPILGNKNVTEVTFRDVSKIINNIFISRNTPVQARRLLSHIRCMFKYARNYLGIVEHNPCADLELPRTKRKKLRVLDNKGIYLFWNKLEHCQMTPVVKLGLKFMLCTLARGIEVRNLKWSEINLEDETWAIPSDKAKNGREHLIPLNKHALGILKQAQNITGHSTHVFGWNKSLNSGQQTLSQHEMKPMGKTAFSHAVRDNAEIFGIEERFTPHDLRRTAATLLTSVSYPKSWVSKLLNHTDSDVTASFYDNFDYFEEKKAGTTAISYILDRILASETINDIPSRKTLRTEFLQQGLVQEFLKVG